MKMRRLRLVAGVLAVAVGAVMAGVLAGAVPAGTPPAVTGQKQLVGPPSALTCGGSVDVQVTLTGTAGVEGSATDIVLVFDLSGSVASPALATAKAEAAEFVQALDAQDGGPAGQLGLGNRVGLVKYRSAAAAAQALTADVTTLTTAIAGLTIADTGADGSDHAEAINVAASLLGAGPKARTMVVFSDGQGGTDGSAAAATAKTGGITIVTVGVGTYNEAELDDWATDKAVNPVALSAGTDASLVTIVGAARAVPAAFSVTETLGSTFAASNASVTKGSVTGTGPLVWTGELLDGEQATLTYRATRNGSDPGSVTEELVSTTAISVTGGTGSVTPATVETLVLPCDAEALLAQQECTGGSCTTPPVSQGGVQYSLNAGTPPAGTDIFVSALASPPPAGACPGFDGNTNGVQFDIRPLTTPGNFEVVIPSKPKWWLADICIGTNLRFITKIGSLAVLRPGATRFGDRWFGLLPSIPRLNFIRGLGFFVGPWITSRRPGPGGSAIVTFTVPFVAGSESFTTNGLAGYDPRIW